MFSPFREKNFICMFIQIAGAIIAAKGSISGLSGASNAYNKTYPDTMPAAAGLGRPLNVLE
jgi:hypothetical protein